MEEISTKQVYEFLMIPVLKTEPVNIAGEQETPASDWPLKPLKCEIESPDVDWNRTWRLSRLRGLGPELTSFILKLMWKLIPTRDKLHRFLPRQYPTPTCQLCPPAAVETLLHALGDCPANQGLPERLLEVVRHYQPGACTQSILTLDLTLDPDLELPVTWAIGSLLTSILDQRGKGRVTIVKTKADMTSGHRLLRDCPIVRLEEFPNTCRELVNNIFQGL